MSASEGRVLVFHEEFSTGSDYILKGRYDDAEHVFDRLIASYPHEPAGYIMKAAVLHYYSMDYDDDTRSDEYYGLIDSAEQYAQNKVDLDTDDDWAWYFLHSARILKALRAVHSGNFVTGILKGRTGHLGMMKIIAGNDDFDDAYLTTGSYRFWKSHATKKVHWLPLIDDDRERGIDDVKRGIDRGKLISPASMTVLIEMLLVYDVEKAVALSRDCVDQYPLCRLFKWQFGEALIKDGSYDEAVCVLTHIAEEMSVDPKDNGSGPLRCWWKLGEMCYNLGRLEESRIYCRKVIRIGQDSNIYNRQHSRIEKARKILARIENE
ncbi:tetratricopeptide repeat protein [Candidatus Latescibacterota bacterium]